MTSASFLRTAEFITTVGAHVAVLVFSFAGYRRTKLRPFALWIAASSIGILLMSGWYITGNSPHLLQSDYTSYMFIYRIGFIIGNILGATGAVMLIQCFLKKLEPKSIPTNAENQN